MRIRLLLLLAVILALLIGLAFSLDRVTLAPARLLVEKLAKPAPAWSEAETANWLVGALFALTLVICLLGTVYLIVAQRDRRGVILLLAVLGALALLIVSRAQLLPVPTPPAAQATTTSQVTPEPTSQATAAPVEVVEFNADPAEWLAWVVSLALVLGIVGLAAGLFALFQQGTEQRTRQRLAQQAGEALRQIQDGGDLGNIILNCYRDMAQTARTLRGVARHRASTPREYQRQLEQAGLPASPLQSLTSLFEAVRYGELPGGPQEQAQAIECLQAIVAACSQETA